MRVSQKAFDLIVSEEVTSKSRYEAKLRHTEWPGASSGVTVGIGYDLGQTDREKIREDWRGRVPESMLSSMLSASGVTGRPAQSLAAELKESIDIPWDVAVAVHQECVLPRWEAVVERALPNTDRLSPDCFGALVSLTFNRGASFGKDGDRYREMRAIKAHMAAGAFDKIPAEIRSMKRIWQGQGVDGLLRRRDAEAELFQHGLSAIASAPRPAESELVDRARAGEGVMATGAGLLRRAREHIGEKYVNAHVPKDDPNWKGPWDCAEFISWLVYQEAGILYGCLDDNVNPSKADAYTGAWQSDVKRRGIRVSVDEAASTVGGIVLRYPPGPGKMGHIALCDGKGGTVEAKGRKYGVVADTVHDRGWHTGVLIPGISYDTVHDTMPVRAPAVLYAINAPNMNGAVVVEIQKALASKGFSPGEIDGEYGKATALAVAHFQESQGLVVDGEVGCDTAKALGVSLTGVKPVEPPVKPAESAKPVEPTVRPTQPTTRPFEPIVPGVEAMNPLIAIAASVLPDIVKAIAGDKAGVVTGAVARAVTEITRTQNPEEAREKLKADPAAVVALQLKLAEIAAAQEEARQKAQLDLLKAQYEEEAKKREAKLEQLRAEIEDTKNARATFGALAQAKNPMAWGAPIVSGIVTVGFFTVLVLLITLGMPQQDNQVIQIINIVVGALAAAFATVVSFWLGSSQGSRFKDAASFQLQAETAKQTSAAIETQARQAEKVLQSAIKPAVAVKAAGETPKMSNFQRCLDIVFVQEGGFIVDPNNPSGATQFGVVLDELRTWRNNQTLTGEDLRLLTREEACEIYRTRYWNVLRCDDLPNGVDLVLFDFGVDAGPSEAAKALQRVIGAEADGSVGPATVAAAKAMSPRDIVTKLSQRRLEYYREQAAWPVSGKAWTNRTNTVEQAAQEMTAAASAVAV